MRTALEGVIAELSYDIGQAVLVTVDIGAGSAVMAKATQNAVEALGLRPRMPVWVLVKAVSARGHQEVKAAAKGELPRIANDAASGTRPGDARSRKGLLSR